MPVITFFIQPVERNVFFQIHSPSLAWNMCIFQTEKFQHDFVKTIIPQVDLEFEQAAYTFFSKGYTKSKLRSTNPSQFNGFVRYNRGCMYDIC